MALGWVFDGTRLQLYTDTDRQLLSIDPHGRQMVISCGAMLDHVRAAFAAHSWHTDIVRLPDPQQPQHLATIEFCPWPDSPKSARTGLDAIHHRFTNRLPMLEPVESLAVVHTLRELVSPHNIELDVLDDSARPRLAAASQQSAALRRYDMLYQTELRWWTGHASTPEGVPPTSMVSDAEFARVGVGRVFPSVPHSERRAEIRDRAKLVVLSTTGESVQQWLHTGEALSAVLLECTAAGLATCPLTHITELPASRSVIANLLPHAEVPQVLIRIGTAPDEHAPPPTPRHPLTDVFTERHG
ncbi:hypothetical protein AB0E01_40490 [Nocardia vinacea]|uniref:Acg family FMN-binding oxidoreductase n=1 Tax=Nocardia vinacea TaxID=96468 RepID=UPI00340E09B5